MSGFTSLVGLDPGSYVVLASDNWDIAGPIVLQDPPFYVSGGITYLGPFGHSDAFAYGLISQAIFFDSNGIEQFTSPVIPPQGPVEVGDRCSLADFPVSPGVQVVAGVGAVS
jgi:hypothetical protein